MADHLKSETDHVKLEEDDDYDARIAFLYSIPAAEPSDEAMPASGTKRKRDSNLTEEPSGDRPRPEKRRKIPTRASQRLKLIGPKRQIFKFNTILTILGTDERAYKRGETVYVCPKGIQPWTRKDRWMLDPGEGMFKQLLDGAWYYVE